MQTKNTLPVAIQPSPRTWVFSTDLRARLPVVLICWSTCWLLTGCGKRSYQQFTLEQSPPALASFCMVNAQDLTMESTEETFKQFFEEHQAQDIWHWICFFRQHPYWGDMDERIIYTDRKINAILSNRAPQERAELEAGIIAYIKHINQEIAFKNLLEGNGLGEIWKRLNQASGQHALDLSGMLQGWPKELQSRVVQGVVQFILDHLPTVVELDLSCNELTQLPDSFERLIQLRKLNLRSNQLSALPDYFGTLAYLQSLDLYANNLINLPDNFGNLINLQRLNLSYNQLKALPESFVNLTNLEILNLQLNQLKTLSESFGNLINLHVLNLSHNLLTQLPESFQNLTKLKLFIGQYPTAIEFRDLVQIEFKDFLHHSGLHAVWYRLNEARWRDSLDLSYMLQNLTPAVQTRVLEGVVYFIRNYCPNLVELTLCNNQLTGLPFSFCKLTQLQVLNLTTNRLTGLPFTFCNLTQLKILQLSQNKLIGLPDTLGNLTELQRLELNNNQLTALPGSLQKLTNLRFFTVANNRLLHPNATIQAPYILVTSDNLTLNPFRREEYVRQHSPNRTFNYNFNREIWEIRQPDKPIIYIRCTQTYPVMLFIKKLGKVTLPQPVPLFLDLSGKEIVEQAYSKIQVCIRKEQ